MRERLSADKPKTAIFIMPALSSDWQGAEGLWITTAGWAAAAKRKFGNSIVITRDRIASAEEVFDYPLSAPNAKKNEKKNIVRQVPAFFKIFINDLIAWKNSHDWKIFNSLELEGKDVAFVWEKHDLFSGRGVKLAHKLNVPYISYVHAPVVWEAAKWGVKRYLWGKLLQKRETAVLQRADYIGVVSKEVRVQLVEMGIDENKIFISPMAVDPDFFKETEPKQKELRKELGLLDKKVIGWIGSFRNFHGLDQVIRSFKKVYDKHPDYRLLLVGDGAERKMMEALSLDLGLKDKIIFTGKKSFRSISKYIAIFDVALVSAKSARSFHYSPQKLREYMAAGKPVLAPKAGEIPFLFDDEVHLKLYEVGNEESILEGVEFFQNDMLRARSIAMNGKAHILETGTWERELEKCLSFINKS